MKNNRNKETQYADFEFSEGFRKEFAMYWSLFSRVIGELSDEIRKNQESFNKWLPRVKSYFENCRSEKAIVWLALSHIGHHSLKKNGRLLTKVVRRILRNTECPDEISEAIMNVVYIVRPRIDLMTLDESIKCFANIWKLMLVVIPGLESLDEIISDYLDDDDDDDDDSEESKEKFDED